MLSVKAEDADNKSLVGTGGQPKVMECLSCPHTEKLWELRFPMARRFGVTILWV